MIRFFEQNLRYPESYKRYGHEGTTLLLLHDRFLRYVTESRKPTREYTVSSRYGETYDEFRDEALRVLRLMPAWEPAVSRIHGPVSIDTGLFFYFNEEGKCGIE